jgi:hypothetical protein
MHDTRFLRGADCDTDHYSVHDNVKERLSVTKRVAQTMDMDRFNLSNLNEEEVKIQYRVTSTNKFVSLENLQEKRGHQQGV